MLKKLFTALAGLAVSFSSLAFGVEFKSTYESWKDPKNTFVQYIDAYDQARVVFCGSEEPSHDGKGQVPTVSEGMGYGLLLSYANDDQELFDKFLRYVLATAENYGCALYYDNQCGAKTPFLMPWIVNDKGQPFEQIPDPSSPGQYFYTNGSATDADMQIAWAVYLAAARANSGTWTKTTFKTSSGDLSYQDVFLGMAHEIRLNDIDFKNFRISPGSQWAAAGEELLYPGYFTPQAFDVLNTAPKPDVSTTPPASPPTPPTPVSEPADLEIVYKNNVAASVSIDYMGGAGTLTVDKNFHPKPGQASGFTVDAVSTAVATMKTKNQYYNNASIQAALYDAQGKKTIFCNYEIVYNNNAWSVNDKGSSPEASYVMKGNVVYVFLTQSDISKVDFDYATIQKNSLQAIADFQAWKDTGVFPNTIYYDERYPDSAWSKTYGFDACRFPLWVSAYLVQHPAEAAMKEVLQNLLTTAEKHIEKGPDGFTFPSQGVNALTGENEGDFNTVSPPLNAPLYVAYKLMGDATANELEDAVVNYDITKLQPSPSDPKGDSTPYFNAALTLICEAILNKKLQ